MEFEDDVAVMELTFIYDGKKFHPSFLSMECGNKVNAAIFLGSQISKKMKLGRTKIDSIVQNVLAPYAPRIGCM